MKTLRLIKKSTNEVNEMEKFASDNNKSFRLMYQDEAGFGRINTTPKKTWLPLGSYFLNVKQRVTTGDVLRKRIPKELTTLVP